jgi:hypothetical protein
MGPAIPPNRPWQVHDEHHAIYDAAAAAPRAAIR